MSNKEQDEQFEEALSILDPVSLVVEVADEAFKIKHFKFLEGLKIVKILKDHPNAIPFELFNMDENQQTDDMIKLIIDAITESGDVVANIIQLHLNKDDEWMSNLEFDEVLNLTLAIVKANVDFFSKTLLPMIPTFTNENS